MSPEEQAVERTRAGILRMSEGAVEIAERFAADARRALEQAIDDPNWKSVDGSTAVMKLPDAISHALCWGLANAMSSVEGAQSYVREHIVALGLAAPVSK